MTTIVIAYDINQTVYHVDAVEGVRKGVVQSVEVNETVLGVTINYTVQFTTPSFGSVVAQETTLFSDIDLAWTTPITGYKAMVQAQ